MYELCASVCGIPKYKRIGTLRNREKHMCGRNWAYRLKPSIFCGRNEVDEVRTLPKAILAVSLILSYMSRTPSVNRYLGR